MMLFPIPDSVFLTMKGEARLALGGIDLMDPLNIYPRMFLSGPDVQIRLADAEGFSLVLGTTELETPLTGETHKSSAASLVMIDKNEKVIWRAPR